MVSIRLHCGDSSTDIAVDVSQWIEELLLEFVVRWSFLHGHEVRLIRGREACLVCTSGIRHEPLRHEICEDSFGRIDGNFCSQVSIKIVSLGCTAPTE